VSPTETEGVPAEKSPKVLPGRGPFQSRRMLFPSPSVLVDCVTERSTVVVLAVLLK
jgi:hypothetical protein